MITTYIKTRQNAPGAISPLRIYPSARKTARMPLHALARGIVAFGQAALLGNADGVDPQLPFLANDFSMGADGWVQLVPYGDFPHAGPQMRGPNGPQPWKEKGKVKFPNGVIQRIDAKAGEQLVANFNSILSRLGRGFGGLPWYIGHNDLDPVSNPDAAAYGWVLALQNRADGVYAQVDWSPDGQALIDQKKFKFFSPMFSGFSDTGVFENGKGVIRPDAIKSVGFTNNPNMPVMPLANDAASAQLEEADLANKGTSAGAKKGWETRRANMEAAKNDPAKAAALAAAKAMKKTKAATKAKPTKPKKALGKGLSEIKTTSGKGVDAVLPKSRLSDPDHLLPGKPMTERMSKNLDRLAAKAAPVGGYEKNPKPARVWKEKPGVQATTESGEPLPGKPFPSIAAKVAAKSMPPPLPKKVTPPPLPKAKATPPPLPLSTAQASHLKATYKTLSAKAGTPNIGIHDLIRESGLPKDQVHHWLRQESAAGMAVPARGEPTLWSDGDRAEALHIPGESPFGLIKLYHP